MISRLNVRAICLIVNVVQCKSGAPVFILLFAFAFRLEVPSLKLLGIIVIISFGVMLTVAKETEFQLEGFILVMLSTVMAGFRWTVTQLLLQKEEYGLNNPFVAMSYFTPLMALITVVFSLALEPWHKLGSTAFFDSTFHIFESCALMLLGGTLAFFMVVYPHPLSLPLCNFLSLWLSLG
jgi:solute carrier family 35 protein C2